MDLSQKPNLRSKGSRRGIKTNNTVKFDVISDEIEHKNTTFDVYKVEDGPTNYHSGYRGYSVYDLPQSLNKDKRWEKIDEIKNNPNYVVIENKVGGKAKKFDDIYVQNGDEDSTEEEEDNVVNYIQGRKGKEVKKKRTPGKKGVKKQEQNDGKIKTDAEYVVQIQTKVKKNEGTLYRDEDAGYCSPEYMKGIEKNNQKKKRKKVKDQCSL
eukprot:gene8395-220_t